MELVQASTPTTDPAPAAFGRPQIFFFCELGGPELRALLDEPLLATLTGQAYGVALAIRELDDEAAAAARLLNSRGIPLVAWLQLSPAEGLWFNLRNYPQAFDRYRAFHGWALAQQLRFQAVGLDIEPPAGALDPAGPLGARHLARRIRQAPENVLYTAARAAYTDLVAKIHHDGYEVHTYQLPLLADDRRAGSTLAQRTLDIVEMPADVEVLICYSSVPFERLDNDLGGALILSYGTDADSIAVGAVGGESGDGLPSLAWEALERDLLLAAHHTDTLYVYSLEGCAERGLLPRIARLDWDGEPHVLLWKRAVVSTLRLALLAALFLARFSRALLAWLGWGLFALLLARELRAAIQRR
jgi:hypothetical protein